MDVSILYAPVVCPSCGAGSEQVRPHNLDDDGAIVPFVPGEVDGCHTALADTALDAVPFCQLFGECGRHLAHAAHLLNADDANMSCRVAARKQATQDARFSRRYRAAQSRVARTAACTV